jgi:hypothetical protein
LMRPGMQGSISFLPIFDFSWHDCKKGPCSQEWAPSEQTW